MYRTIEIDSKLLPPKTDRIQLHVILPKSAYYTLKQELEERYNVTFQSWLRGCIMVASREVENEE